MAAEARLISPIPDSNCRPDIRVSSQVAIKLEPETARAPRLLQEYKSYRKLEKENMREHRIDTFPDIDGTYLVKHGLVLPGFTDSCAPTKAYPLLLGGRVLLYQAFLRYRLRVLGGCFSRRCVLTALLSLQPASQGLEQGKQRTPRLLRLLSANPF